MPWMPIRLYWQRSLGITVGSAIVFCMNSVGAQITPDGTLPNNSNVQLNSDTYNITGGTQESANLFHSFQQFSIPTGSIAYFNNGLSIQNILTRVTGKSISNIDGLIRANGTANFFFINPNGIIFGQNARLDIGGSFLASTASSLKFADGVFFSATNPESTSLLTISVPIGLQYGVNSGRIQVQGNGQGRRDSNVPISPIIDTTDALRVGSDQTLALVGGALDLEAATLKTAGGRIELGSVSGEGFVSLTPINKGFFLNYDGVQNFDNIQLLQKAIVDASGTGGGDMQVTGRRISLSDNSQIETSTLRAGTGGTMVINAAELIEAVGVVNNSPERTGFFVTSYQGATGTPGSLTINTRDLLIRVAQIVNNTLGSGKAGNVTINATNSIQFISTLPNSPSYGLSTAAVGAATGSAGDVIINTRDLIIRDGGYVSARTFGSAKGGNVTINATNSVQVTGTSLNAFKMSSGLYTQSRPNTTGDAGNLTINTGELLVKDGAIVAVRSEGTGNAGNLNINARSIRLDNGALLTANTQSTKVDLTKEQATININSKDLIITRNSNITTNAKGENVIGGNINIDADVVVGFGNSNITANSENFRGGNVRINTEGIFGIQFRDVPSVSTSDITATGATQKLSGNVQITRPDIDPTKGLIELPIKLVDPTQQISTACTSRSRHHSTFVSTGRGGLPMSPNELLQDTSTLSAWVRSRSRVRYTTNILKPSAVTASVTHPTTTPITEATGWIVDNNKNIELVAQAPGLIGECPKQIFVR